LFATFVDARMEHILEQVMTPKVQVERIVGPILGMIIKDVLSKKYTDCFEMITPEFPLRKAPLDGWYTCQSTNIDYLLYSTRKDALVFVELKTTDTTYEPEQARIYLDVIEQIEEEGAFFLLRDVEDISRASRESGKYARLLKTMSIEK
jgi:hypothetical protein